MTRDLGVINRDLDAVEAQLASLEKSLKETRIKRTELTKERDAELQRVAELERRQKEQQEEKDRAAAAAAAAAAANAATNVKIAAGSAGTTGGGESPIDAAALQARIAELQQQVEEQKKKVLQASQRSRSPTNSRTSPTRQQQRSSPRTSRSPQRPTVAAARPDGSRSPQRGARASSVASPPSSPRRQQDPPAARPEQKEVVVEEEIVEEEIIKEGEEVVVDDSEYKKKTGWKKPGWTIGRGGNKKKQDETTDTPSATAPTTNGGTDTTTATPPASPSPSSPTQMECVSPYRNSKSAWEKPAWAHAAPLEEDNVAVDNSSIMNPLLRPKQDGYQRKVFAKDLVGQQGKFVKAQEKQPDPRLTWIVVRINDDAVPGKIVMHLHGKDVNGLVDKFFDLKGQEIERTGEQLMVQGEPKFFITTATAKGLDSKQEVYGVVQEGQEIVAKLLAAGPEATFSIKQAHIFPIKKSKKGL